MRVAAGEIRVHGQITRHVSDVVADLDRLQPAVHAEDRRGAGGRTNLVQDRADHGGLASAIWPEETEDLAGHDVEVQLDESREVAVVLGELVCAGWLI